ncbi:Lrp/AsnC family transcriptional regulator [Saccharopolyspora indica]|uniref:Lrp/AsnC family transcriptional regulator n=1 Tax=Saccharopolyspora indica TaxID=1229659 RepID=UPI0022EAA063|nr:Lrp/AsnC family transcriptional regulator [Saccharopolyspora indica]MDA3642946.1 Lrp/AsnC family transcriptional regulator [Saccharopolyspora indica]
MQDHAELDEVDLALVNALQINPRAPWSLIGGVLGIDPVTAARRWARLERTGLAWISAYPPTTPAQATAFVELGCEPGRGVDVARELAADPQAMTIDVTAGGRDVLVTVSAPDPQALSSYLLERMSRVGHLQQVRSHPAVRIYTEASRWRLRALDHDQAARMAWDPGTSGLVPLTEQDWAIAVALAADGRAPVAALADAAGTSTSTVRRRMARMLASRQLRLRCELARTQSGWPVYAWFFARVPPAHLDDTARALARIPEVRAVTSAAGPHNLIIAVWQRSLADVQDLETHMSRRLPHLDIVDRSIVVRPVKLVGRLLDERGHATGCVPLDTRRSP